MHRTDEWIERTARLGYASVGITYIIAGSLTVAAVLGLGGETASWRDAITTVRNAPLGLFALIVIGIGLTGYGAWGVISGITDSDRRGGDWKGAALRIRAIGSGIVHLVMAFSIFRFVLTHHSGGSGSDANARHWTSRLMDFPFGRWIVAVAGLTFVAYGVGALWRAWEAKLGQRLHVPNKIAARELLVLVCRFGIAARGIVIGVIGASLLQAAIRHDPAKTRATKGALQRIAEAPYGRWLLLLVAAGLAAYGVYAITKGRYRSIEV